jgi:hypothetical protein
MKNKITTGYELLFQIAADGDAAAFYSLISPALREYFLKLRSRGDTLEESSEKIYESSITLFRKFQHAHPENFDSWLESELETISHHSNNDNEIVLDKNLFHQCDAVLADAQKQLLRAASAMKNVNRKRRLAGFLGRYKLAFSLFAAALLIIVLSMVLFGYYGMRLNMTFSEKSTFLHRSISGQDSTSVVSSLDTAKHADSTLGTAVSEPPVQVSKPVPPPPSPKPRPRVTYTPPTPVPETETSESYQSSRSSSDQVQQSAPSRTERYSQSSGYSAQNQTTESQSSSYNTSGSSSSATQQSSQQQLQNTQEQNQP